MLAIVRLGSDRELARRKKGAERCGVDLRRLDIMDVMRIFEVYNLDVCNRRSKLSPEGALAATAAIVDTRNGLADPTR